MQFLDFPSELLRDIFEKVGGSELRRSVEYLLICKRWYDLAHDVFLSGLPVTELRFSARDIQLLPPRSIVLMNMIREQTVRLSIRLMGHPSPEISETPWISVPELEHEESAIDNTSRALHFEGDTEAWGLSGIDAEKIKRTVHLSYYPQYAWMRRINAKLGKLADRLAPSNMLEEIILEMSREIDKSAEPRWDYLYDSVLRNMINRLPNYLSALTLDTCGTDIVAASGHPLHLCPILAQNLGRYKTVRLRMRCICSVVFNLTNDELAIESLIVKLSLPMFGDFSGGDRYFDSRRCFSNGSTTAKDDIMSMCDGARSLMRRHQLRKLRISFRDPRKSGICLLAWDAIAEQYLYEGSENFCYEDEGRAWESWEDSSTLQVGHGID